MPKIVDQQARKLEILEAGLEVSNTGKFTMEKVAHKAGLSRTAAYQHFKNKAEFIKAIEDNFCELTNEVEKTKYILQSGLLSDEQYLRIWEVLK